MEAICRHALIVVCLLLGACDGTGQHLQSSLDVRMPEDLADVRSRDRCNATSGNDAQRRQPLGILPEANIRRPLQCSLPNCGMIRNR